MAFLFPDFFDKPQHIRFIEQEPNETIELFLRQHWFTNVGWIFLTTLALFVPIIVIQLDASLHLNLFAQVPSAILTNGLILWYMLVLAYALEKFLYWYYNIYIVTNLHIVDVDFFSLLLRQITNLELKDIESVRTEMGGIIRPIFNFGHVVIETAAKTQSAKFEDVPKPDVVADRIEDLRTALGGGGE